MSLAETLENNKGKLSQIQSSCTFLEEATALNEVFTSIVTLCGDVAESTKTSTQIFFNDLDLGDLGEGLNLLKGNSYCGFIPQEYIYLNFRSLFWENLESYTEGASFAQQINEQVDLISKTAAETERKFKAEDGTWTTEKAKLESQLNSLESQLKGIQSAGNAVYTAIVDWLALGNEVMIKHSLYLNVYYFPDVVINSDEDQREVIYQNIGIVDEFSPEVGRAVRCTDEIREKRQQTAETIGSTIVEKTNPDSSKVEYNIKTTYPPKMSSLEDDVKKEVLKILDVKNRSQELCDRLSEVFSQF